MLNRHEAVSRPLRVGGYVRISDDPLGLEKGVTRQREDVTALAEQLGWSVTEFYVENDTSAYRKRRVVGADGRSNWVVVRPEFRRMLADYEDGKIDGIIVYDLDRLARQNRDLEDLIDLVQYYRRPVKSVTGQLDLMTDAGQAMARILVTMANKSSADTARRVARARLQIAQEGRHRNGGRRFGWKDDGVSLEPVEADALKRAAERFVAGEAWTSLVLDLGASGIRPVKSERWHLKSLKRMLLSPRIAGIVVYTGALHPDRTDARPHEVHHDPFGSALRDQHGQYVRGEWKQIITVELWEAVVTEAARRKEGKDFTGAGTRKYLLSGLLRCGRVLDDGRVCNKPLNGTRAKNRRTGEYVPIYKCPQPSFGGCGRIQRQMDPVDKLIEDLLFLHLEKNQPQDADRSEPEADGQGEVERELADLQSRLERLRIEYAKGVITPDTFFALVPVLEATIKERQTELAKRSRDRMASARYRKTPEQVREEWEKAPTMAAKRAILGQYLRAVVVHPARWRGNGFDHETIEPIWL
ncbi:recombinase family protein [Kitasatospora sp. NPDC048538]|uniref:recombinase family protein n=1 Tax=Kitasatospora sp. NPDC048538 TaxID=3155633 RepID=UPI0033D0FF23